MSSAQVKPEISSSNKYYISKHRYYELLHFCRQYIEWKEERENIAAQLYPSSSTNTNVTKSIDTEYVERQAIRLAELDTKIEMIEDSIRAADETLYPYLLKGITEGYAFPYLQEIMDMPCGKDMYYDRYRKFYWILDKCRK